MYKSISIHNISDRDFNNITVGGVEVGNIKAGEKSDYVNVNMSFAYTVTKMTIDGIYINGQSLNFGSNKLTHEIDIIDLQKGWLDIEVIRE